MCLCCKSQTRMQIYFAFIRQYVFPCVFSTGILLFFEINSVHKHNLPSTIPVPFLATCATASKLCKAFLGVCNLVDNGCGSVSVLRNYLWCREVDIFEISNQSSRFRIIRHSHTSTHGIICMCVYVFMWCVFTKLGFKVKIRS